MYLHPEVKFEPLVCRWYAWPHLLAPAQLGLNLAFRLLPLLRNFVSNPEVHIAANADPSMYGGPFVGLGHADVARVRALIEQTEAGCADLIALAHDWRAFEKVFQQEATGFSLDDWYARLPASLRGLVECLYDSNHHPRLRLFESLLADCAMLDQTQEIMLARQGEQQRDFFMSTPRLERDGALFLKLRFDDARIEALARARTEPCSLDALAAQLDIAAGQRALFDALFTAEPPAKRGDARYQGPGLRVRYFGHACVLVETAAWAMLFDPMLAIETKDDGRLTLADLPDHIDYVVLSHAHQDHFNPEMLLQLRHRIGRVVVPRSNSGCIADPSMKLVLAQLGLRAVDEMDLFDTLALDGGTLTALPFTGEHGDLDIYSKSAYALRAGGKTLLFLVDSDGRDAVLYERIMARLGKVDIMFIGMECHGAPLSWLYEPLMGKPLTRRNNESRRLTGADSARAASIQQQVGAAQTFVYAMGQEPWLPHLMGLQYTPDAIQLVESDRYVAQCRVEGIAAERLFGSKEIVLE